MTATAKSTAVNTAPAACAVERDSRSAASGFAADLNSEPAGQRLLGYPAAAAYLDVKQGSLRSLVSRRQIPHVRLTPRLVRFDRADLDAWIAARRVP